MYCVYEEEIQVEEDQSYFMYGIEVAETAERSGDLSVVRKEVEELVAWMNRLEVSPVHMADIADDFLADR